MKAVTGKQTMNDVDSAVLNPEERVAALADSALSEADAQRAIDMLLASPELCTSWHRLHRTADYLRSEELAACDAGPAFWQGLSARLEQEPTLLAPKPVTLSPRRAWMRYGLPGVSVAAAVAMVSWLSFPQLSGKSGEIVASSTPVVQPQVQSQLQAQTAQSEMPALVANAPADVTQQPVALETNAAAKAVDPRQLRNYLAAHQQFSASALRGPVAVHSASFNIIRTED